MSNSTSINIKDIPEIIATDLLYFVEKYNTSKRQYAIDAIKSYNLLQKEVERFTLDNPGERISIKLEITSVDKSEENARQASVLVY